MAEAAIPQDSTVKGTLCEDASNVPSNANEHQQPDRTKNTTSQPVLDVPHDQNSGHSSVTSTQDNEWINSWLHSGLYAGHEIVAEQYIETFKSFIGPELWDAYFEKMFRQGARAMLFAGAQPGQFFTHEQFRQCLDHASSSSHSTIVVIDIAPEWIGVLGGLFKIEQQFFVNHFWWRYAPLPPDMCPFFLNKPPTPDMVANTGVEGDRQYLFDEVFYTQARFLPQGTWHRNVWIAPDADEEEDEMVRITEIDSRRAISDTLQGRSYQSMYLFGHFRQEPVVFQSNVWKGRISYCKLGDSKHLLLVDGHRWTKAPSRPRGDILIADQNDFILRRDFSEAYLRGFSRDELALFASQRASKVNHFATLICDALQDAHDILDLGDSEEFFPHLTAKRCKADVSELEGQVTQIADADIADSDTATAVFGRLHDSRRAVAKLRSIATNVHVRAEGQRRKDDLQRLTTSALEECANLRILIDKTIQLVMGTITIKEAQTSRINSERATVLTFLACIYLPLSLVTGIFGMNIKEINGGAPSWWFCLIALAVIAFGTPGLGFWLYPTAAVHTLQLSASWAARRYKAILRYIQLLHLPTAPARERLRAIFDLENPQIEQPGGNRHDVAGYKTVGWTLSTKHLGFSTMHIYDIAGFESAIHAIATAYDLALLTWNSAIVDLA